MTSTQEPIYPGDEVILRATIKNRAGVLANPTAATGHAKHTESGTVINLTYAQNGTGIWEAIWTAGEPGVWYFSCDAIGAIVKSGEKALTVAKRRT